MMTRPRGLTGRNVVSRMAFWSTRHRNTAIHGWFGLGPRRRRRRAPPVTRTDAMTAHPAHARGTTTVRHRPDVAGREVDDERHPQAHRGLRAHRRSAHRRPHRHGRVHRLAVTAAVR